MKRARTPFGRILSVLLAVVMLVCAVPLTASAHSYSSDYRKWSQGGSDYEGVRTSGCWIVAMSKLIYETNVDRSASFNPDTFAVWEVNNGRIASLNDVGQNGDGGEAPIIYAQQNGSDLTYIENSSNHSDEHIMQYTTAGGYYTIVQVFNPDGSPHYVMINNELTKATGQLYCYDSFTTTGEVEPQPLSRYPSRGNIYVYQAKINVGDIIYFGSYPQSKVTDSETISALNNNACNWQSYRYYSGIGTGLIASGQMTEKDYMQYCDILYSNQKYRGVKFDTYRPYDTGNVPLCNYQSNNGYRTGTTYWFKYEPLQWQVLDPAEGLVMCVNLVDSQPYNNYLVYNGVVDAHNNTIYWGDPEKTYYANDYVNSSLRQWLNETFYATAFTEAQQSRIIVNQNQNNDGYYTLTGNMYYSDYDSEPTNDKIYLLSYADALNPAYGFSSSNSIYDNARQAKGTDYAKCQGLCVAYSGGDGTFNGYSQWLLRSPGSESLIACSISECGDTDFSNVSYTDKGIRPVCKISNLTIDLKQPVSTYTHTHIPAETIKENEYPATTESGGSYDEVIYCAECGEELSRKTIVIDPLPPETETNEQPTENLNIFQRIIQWFRNLFDTMFGWLKR